MEAAPQLEERAHAPAHRDGSLRGARHARDDLEERRLAGAVLADEADRLAAADLEVDVLERAKVGKLAAAQHERDERAQPVASGRDLRIVLDDPREAHQRRFAHRKSSKYGARRL